MFFLFCMVFVYFYNIDARKEYTHQLQRYIAKSIDTLMIDYANALIRMMINIIRSGKESVKKHLYFHSKIRSLLYSITHPNDVYIINKQQYLQQ